jgi:EmrB/QacA subfamily drug resistance transporter
MATREVLDPALRRTAIAVVVGALAVIFDTTIVSIALRTLATDLRATVDTIQWVSTGYLLALGVTIPVVGWAQSRLGGKRLWLLGLSIFLLASILCSLAWSAPSLIAFRVLQGIGGGIMLPLMSTLVVQAARGKNLGRVIATMSLPAVLGPILGPVLGGLILTFASWRWMFWVNVPFCVVGLALAIRMLPADRPDPRVRLDTVGLALLSPAVIGMLYGLSNVSRDGGFGRTDVFVPLVAGIALLGGFIGWAAHRAGGALVDIRLLRFRPLAASSALLFLSGFALYGAMLLLPLYWQEVRGTDALGAGLLLVPQGIGTFLSRSLAGRLTDRIGARWISITGFAIVTIATVPFALATPTTSEVLLMAALLVRGFGLGAVTIPLMSVAFLGLERADVPHASTITRIATQVGGSFGVAVLAVILHAAIIGAQAPGDVAAAFDRSFWWAIGFGGIAVLLSFLLPGRPDARKPVVAAVERRPRTPTAVRSR